MSTLGEIASRIGNQALTVTYSNSSEMDLDEMLDQMTNTSTGDLYGTFKSVTNSADGVTITENTIADATTENTGVVNHSAWDPRLERVDGFVMTSNDSAGSHPTIVPFGSATAAGAFFDMVFTIQRKVDSIVDPDGSGDGYGAQSSLEEVMAKNATSTKSGDTTDTDYIYRASDKVKSSILNDSNSYGVASVVNPYTLTKLCGGLVKGNVDDNTGTVEVENHMYDVRDSRRFYGNVIKNGDDVLSVSNPTTTNIITYSNNDKWGRTPYYFQDFVFCKFWNVIPNNRLITLRKYHAPVYDNLQFSSMKDTVGSSDSNTGVQTFAPIATVVTYFGDDTGNTLSSLFSFTTGTNWQDKEAKIHEVSGDQGSDPHALIDNMFDNGGGFHTGEANWVSKQIKSVNFITGKMFSYGKFLGLLSPDGYSMKNDQGVFEKWDQTNVDPYEQLYENRIKGPVNRVDSTKARKEGIKYDQKLTITCQYVARPIGGINTKAAMLDILANCMEIASVDAVFWGGGYRFMVKPELYPFKNTKFKNTIMDDLYSGRIFGKNGALAHTVEGMKEFGTTDQNGNNTGSFDWSNVTGKLREFLGETMGAIGEMVNSISNTLFGSSSSLASWLNDTGNAVAGNEEAASKGKSKLNSLLGNVNSMWRSQVIQKTTMPTLNGMRALLTGEAIGNWHLTVGNPLNPIMVIGNLICSDMHVECGEELGPDDFPLELKVTYTLEHAMARDKSSIQSMFNRGNGRIYQLPDWIRASSDYESKVDNYTGPNNSNNKFGFTTPKFMNNMKMASIGGGIGGYKTYKMSKATTLATNAHTDNTIIAKFTPPDVDAAVSNIKTNSSNTFFGANVGSRAWIRGTAATRKLMN